MAQSDFINSPPHYTQGEIECIDAMVAAHGKQAVEKYCVLAATKYLWRYELKNGTQDLEKALWYIGKAIALRGNNDKG